MAEYAHTVVARKAYWCADSCKPEQHTIWPGEPYVRCVAFPDGDVNCDTVPWTARICADCYCRYGKDMPPPRKSRARRQPLDPKTRNAAVAVLMSADAPRITRPRQEAQ